MSYRIETYEIADNGESVRTYFTYSKGNDNVEDWVRYMHKVDLGWDYLLVLDESGSVVATGKQDANNWWVIY